MIGRNPSSALLYTSEMEQTYTSKIVHRDQLHVVYNGITYRAIKWYLKMFLMLSFDDVIRQFFMVRKIYNPPNI